MAATVTEVMNFFGYARAGEFMQEWKNLPEEYKEYFKNEVGKVLGK